MMGLKKMQMLATASATSWETTHHMERMSTPTTATEKQLAYHAFAHTHADARRVKLGHQPALKGEPHESQARALQC